MCRPCLLYPGTQKSTVWIQPMHSKSERNHGIRLAFRGE